MPPFLYFPEPLARESPQFRPGWTRSHHRPSASGRSVERRTIKAGRPNTVTSS